MTPRDLPFVSQVADYGPEDPLFDSLLLIGPPLIALIIVLGRNVLTEGLALAYIGFFVGTILYREVE